jgi:hypothetical protein
MKQGLDLAADRREEQLIYENAHSNILLYGDDVRIAEKNKKVKSVNKLYLNKLDAIASIIKRWSAGDARPINGAFVGFDTTYSMSGKAVMPIYL